MFVLKNKTILIVSPQSWGKMHVSKHHYAIELAKRGNTVYFMNPPVRKIGVKIKVEKIKAFNNLFTLTYSLFFPYNLRFHIRPVFSFLLLIQLKIIKKIIKENIDIVWCFETNLFSNLKHFKRSVKIYHPADNISGKHQVSLIKSSNFIFSVSDVIIDKMKHVCPNKKYFFVNHGLSDIFININKKDYNTVKNNKISVYYIGNILINSLDREITKKIIAENIELNFTFIGSYKPSDNNLGVGSDKSVSDFIKFLINCKNVVLRGPLSPNIVAKEIQNADVFLVLINPLEDHNKGSNSHKILEYLSTGKVIVANHLSSYDRRKELIEMLNEDNNEKLPSLFKKVLNNLTYYNSPELQQKRISFALENTYEKQIDRIEKIISDHFR